MLLGKLPEADINVVQHLDMVADKPNRLVKNPGVAFLLHLQDRVLDGGTEPGSARHPLALKSEGPVAAAQRRHFHGDHFSSLFRLLLIGIASLDGARGDAMGREDNGHTRAALLAGT